MIIITVTLQNKHQDSAEGVLLILSILYLVLSWLRNVRNVQIFCFKTYSLKHFGITNREKRHRVYAGGLCWCWEVMFCAHVISEIRTLVSDGCLDHVCTESVNPEPGLVHYVGISVNVCGTFTLLQTSNIQLLLLVINQTGSSNW